MKGTFSWNNFKQAGVGFNLSLMAANQKYQKYLLLVFGPN